jgi:hypothetical protein
MNTKDNAELTRIREARMRISEKFNHDPELLVRHYMDLQKRHQDRLVFSTEARRQQLPEEVQ